MWNSRVKTSKRGSLEQEPKSSERYSKNTKEWESTLRQSGNILWTKMSEFTWNWNPSENLTSGIWTLQARISYPETFKPISVCLDICQNAVFKTFKRTLNLLEIYQKPNLFIVFKGPKLMSQTKEKLSHIPFPIKLWSFRK